MTLLIFVHRDKLLDLDHAFRMFISLLVGSAAKTFSGHTHTQTYGSTTKEAGILVVRNVASTTSIETVLYF